MCIVGGLSHEKQMRLLAKGPEIIVATPGRLFELVQDDPNLQSQLVAVKCLVIDEADRMIQKVAVQPMSFSEAQTQTPQERMEPFLFLFLICFYLTARQTSDLQAWERNSPQGHFEEMQLILKFMNANRVAKRQNLVFSATLTMDPHLPVRVMEKSKKKLGRLDQLKALVGMTKPKVIDTSKKIGECRFPRVRRSASRPFKARPRSLSYVREHKSTFHSSHCFVPRRILREEKKLYPLVG